MFINGRLVSAATHRPGFRLTDKLKRNFLGAAALKDAEGRFKGVIDEVRISKTMRYTQHFFPPARLKTDEKTLALYHFDAAHGNKLIDSSGNNNHGTIVGAKWVKEIGPGWYIPYDNDRRAAEYVLANGGAVQIDGLDRYLKSPRALPVVSFRLSRATLADNPVTDQGLGCLQDLPELRYLDLRDTQVTVEAAAKLKKLIPDCRILTGKRPPVKASKPR